MLSEMAQKSFSKKQLASCSACHTQKRRQRRRRRSSKLQWLTVTSFSAIFPCSIPSPFSQQKSSSTGRSAGVRSSGAWLKPKCQKQLQNSWDVGTNSRNCWCLTVLWGALDCIAQESTGETEHRHWDPNTDNVNAMRLSALRDGAFNCCDSVPTKESFLSLGSGHSCAHSRVILSQPRPRVLVHMMPL